MTDVYGRPPQPKPTSPFVWVGLGCGLVLFGIAGFIAFLSWVVFTSMRSSTPYQEAMRRAESDPRVIAALGRPVKAGWLITGSIQTNNRDGSANLSIPLSGPRDKAKLYVKALRSRGRWTLTELTLDPEKGEEIDLLTSTRGSPDTSPPGE